MASLDTAIVRYHDLLERKHFAATVIALDRATQEQNLTWLGKPLCGVLRPCFITERAQRRAIRAATLVTQGLRRISEALVRETDLRRQIGLTEVEEAALRADPGLPREIVGRLDGFVGPDGAVRFIEFNPDPGAVGNYYKLTRLFSALPIMREFGRAYRVKPTLSWSAVADVLMGLTGRVLWRGGITVIKSSAAAKDPLLEQLDLELDVFRRMLRKIGVKLEMVVPDALSFRQNKVFDGRHRVAFAYVTDWEGLLRAFPFDHAFWRAIRTGNLCVVNAWASKVLRGNKSVYALLSDGRYRPVVGSDLFDALMPYVPWSRLLREGRTTSWSQETIDVLPFARTHRDELVLKPAASQGGKGVVLGWLSTESEWSHALDSALSMPHIVQRRVAIRHERFPAAVDGHLEIGDYATDLNAFVWNTETVRGLMARVSRGALMNVTAGGGTLAPVFSVRADA
jgi:hypothetical protein